MTRAVLALAVIFAAARLEGADIPRADLGGAEQPVIDHVNAALRSVESSTESADAWGRYAMVLHAHSCRPEADLAYAEAQHLAPNDFRWSYFRGINLMERDTSAAIEHLKRAVQLDARYGPAFIRLGIALEESGRDYDARLALEEALRLEPNNLSAHVHMGQLELQGGNIKAAIQHLETARQGRPTDAAVLSGLAQAYARQGERERARELAAAARENEPGGMVDDPRFNEVVNEAMMLKAFLDRASVHFANGATDRVFLELNRAIRIGHDAGIVHGQIAREYLKLGDFRQSIESCRSALAAGRDTAEIRVVLGVALMYDGQLGEAERTVQEALKRAPTNADALWLSGRIAADRGDHLEAVKRWDHALAVHDDLRTRSDRAELLSRLGRHDEAISALEAIAAARPHDSAVWIALAEAKQQAGDLDGAVADFDQALRRASVPVAGRRAVAVLIAQRRFAEAERRLRALRSRWPRNANLRNDLAWLLATCPDDRIRSGSEAVALVMPLVRLTARKEPGLLDTLAAALAESGQPVEAVAVMDEAIALLPEDVPPERLARFRARRQRYSLGRAWYDEP